MKGNEISFIAGKLADAETLIAAKVRTAAGYLHRPILISLPKLPKRHVYPEVECINNRSPPHN